VIITAITPSPRKPGRFTIQVDGLERVTLSLDVIERLRLGAGAVLDDRIALAVEREAAILETYDRALNMLAVRGRSTAELRRLLLRKGEAADCVEAAIQHLLTAGLLDDASFARQFARSKALGAGLSRRRLQQELARRGVARDVSNVAIEEALAEEGIDDATSIERVARKKLPTLARLDAATQRRRLSAFLARRGYDFDDINRVVGALLVTTAAESEE